MARTRTRTPQRRKKVWARNDEIADGIDAAGQVFDLASDYVTLAGTNHLPVGITIRGILLDLCLENTAVSTSTTSGVTIGIIRAETNVSTDVPMPEVQPHLDWMWWQFIGFGTSPAGTLQTTFDTLGGPMRLGAQRKIEELGTNLWFCIQTSGAGLVVDARIKTSVLMLLP